MQSPTLSPSHAFGDLEPYRGELTAYCYRMLGSPFDAEDAVQDAFVRAWRNRERFEGRAAMRSWLYRIATNVCLDMLKGKERRARPDEPRPAVEPIEGKPNPPARGARVRPIPPPPPPPPRRPGPGGRPEEGIRSRPRAPPQHPP